MWWFFFIVNGNRSVKVESRSRDEAFEKIRAMSPDAEIEFVGGFKERDK